MGKPGQVLPDHGEEIHQVALRDQEEVAPFPLIEYDLIEREELQGASGVLRARAADPFQDTAYLPERARVERRYDARLSQLARSQDDCPGLVYGHTTSSIEIRAW